MSIRRAVFALALSATGSFLCPIPATASDPMVPMQYLVGKWTCNGSFPASGKSIASTIRFDLDLGGAALVKHHDDLAPGSYHAIEVWVYQPDSKHYALTITDNFGGIRGFTSDSWQAQTLTVQGNAAKPAEKFIYTNLSPDTMRVDWEIARDGAHFVLGDTLACARERGPS
ncbi:MAG: hypothetical protein M3N19_11680 [Candidatus Eremiobacteraeota bacterium]|nr:hypothetical protein [Candidatus Eremiobacteraeota bacterium]